MNRAERLRSPAGFSLVELVVIIVIAAILAAIAIPRFTQPEIDAVWFREQVKAAVRYAQRQAVAQRRPVYVVLLSETELVLCYDADCSTPLTQFGAEAKYVLNAPSGVTMKADPAPFSFNGLGQPNPVAGVTLTVGGGTITVAAETGYVH